MRLPQTPKETLLVQTPAVYTRIIEGAGTGGGGSDVLVYEPGSI